MKDVRNIDSAPDPRRKAGEKDVVDPERFEKALKVEKSDETDKREKRNRPRRQEEEDDTLDEGVSVPVPEGLFKEYMTENEKGDSIFDPTDGTKAHLVSDSENTAPSREMFIADKEEGDKSTVEVAKTEAPIEAIPINKGEGSSLEDDEPHLSAPEAPSENNPNVSSPPPNEESPNVSTPPPPPEEEESPGFIDSPEENSPSSQKSEENREQSPISSSSDKKTEKKEHTKKAGKKNKGTKASPTQKKDTPPEMEKKSTAPTEKDAIIPAMQAKPTGKKSTSKIDPTSSKEEHLIDPVDTPSNFSGDGHDKKDSDTHFDDTIVAPASIPLASPTGAAALELSPFSNMPNDVFELFKKMVGLMTVQNDSGKSTTTITLNMPSSVFNKCDVVLEHFDTAPHAYNVQFLGNPEAMDRFAKSMKGLNNAITDSKLTFSINLLPPKLSKAYAGRVDRKEEGGGDDGSQQDGRRDSQKER